MPKSKETRILNYPSISLYELVLDIEKYPQFLPWCEEAVILEKHDNYLIADLTINFTPYREKYRSKVEFGTKENRFVNVSLIEGPFKHLFNNWTFTDLDDKTIIEFSIDFEFKSKILESIIGIFFEKALKKMTDAFEERAHIICK